MSPNRHKVILDEQAFQGLLAAAFIVQEYNGRENVWLKYGRKNGDPPSSDWLSRPAPITELQNDNRPAEGPLGESGPDEFRPGERLQRNWASMWLLSKEKDVWSVHSPGTGESAQEDVSSLALTGGLESGLASDSENPGLDRRADAEGESTAAAMDEMTDQPTQPGFTHEDSDLAVPTHQLSASDDSFPLEASTEESAEPTFDDNDDGGSGDRSSDNLGNRSFGNHSLMRHLTDLRVTLRFHRSNLYLVAAVFVAALALFWPAAGSTRRAALSPWERALVTLGLAEAPEPAVRLQGDPSIEVWIDPHTALYYCPGEEQYGKTADGRFSSQREAQMDRFEPAGRSTCE